MDFWSIGEIKITAILLIQHFINPRILYP